MNGSSVLPKNINFNKSDYRTTIPIYLIPEQDNKIKKNL